LYNYQLCNRISTEIVYLTSWDSCKRLIYFLPKKYPNNFSQHRNMNIRCNYKNLAASLFSAIGDMEDMFFLLMQSAIWQCGNWHQFIVVGWVGRKKYLFVGRPPSPPDPCFCRLEKLLQSNRHRFNNLDFLSFPIEFCCSNSLLLLLLLLKTRDLRIRSYGPDPLFVKSACAQTKK
jgi:hypothetical protein